MTCAHPSAACRARQRAARTLAAIALMSVAGCMNGPRLGESGQPLAVVKQAELPPPSGADLAAAAAPFRVGPLDKVVITVFGVPELSGSFQADASGRLSMPLVGELEAAGTTPGDLASVIAGKLRGNYVRDPQVTVNLEETASHRFTVDGEVREPGSYPVVGSMSLMRAVAAAKGASEFARLDDVVVFRTVNGKAMAALYNLGAIRRGLYADPQIYPNDVIVVGDSKQRRLFHHLMQAAPLLTSPLVIALQR